MKTARKYVYMVMLILAIACLGGCYQGANYYYKNSENYTAGDREITDKIDTIYIDYTSGNVEVVRNTSGTTKITETASRERNEDQMVHTWVDGSILYVKYCASKTGIDMRNMNKKLKIEIPEDASLELVNVSVSSADMVLENLETNMIKVNSSSGRVDVSAATKNAEISTSSGSISFEQHGESDMIKMSASSGSVNAIVEKAGQIKLQTSSGDIQAQTGSVTEFEASASSGACRAQFDEVPQKTKIGTSSGKVSVYLPENPDLKVDVSTSSGKFYYDIPLAKDGDKYVCGEGNNYIEVSTSSGDVDFLTNK